MNEVSPLNRKLLLFVAIAVDVIEFIIGFIPVAGQVINFFVSVVAWTIFAIWLLILGVPLLPAKSSQASKKMTRVIINVIADWIPVFKMFWPSFYLTIKTLLDKEEIPNKDVIK